MASVELPSPLRPWAEPLALFGEVVHEGLGHWLGALRTLLGPLSVPQTASHGDPDGYCGLSRRGSYERLLLSEWVMALEAPDEFLRRASTGEHVFVAPAFREPKSSSRSVALLDCGPRQLGAPRLAQLAALVVLHQRAQEGSAAFRFGVLQDEQTRLHELDTSSIPQWLRHRSWTPASPYLATWAEELRDQPPQDLWLVGGHDLLGHATRMRCGLLEIDEGPERTLRIRVSRPGAPGGTATLSLPHPDTCVRILRKPLAPPPARPAKDEPSALSNRALGQLSVDGRRWLVPRADGGINALHVPNTVAERPGNSKQILPQTGSTLIAADMKGKRPIALALGHDGTLLLRGSGLALPGEGSSRSVVAPRATGLEAPDSLRPAEGRLLNMYVTTAQALDFHAWILGVDGQLWEMNIELQRGHDGTHEHRHEPTLKVRDSACHHVRRLDPGVIAWVSRSERRVLSIPMQLGSDTVLTDEELAGCVLGPLHVRGRAALRFAVPNGNELVVHDFATRGEQRPLDLPNGFVFGLAVRNWGAVASSPIPLFIGPDHKRVFARTPADEDRQLLSTTTPITGIQYEPISGRIVWHSEDERGVYDFDRQSMVLRLPAEGWVS